MPFETTTTGQGVQRRGRVFTLRLEPDVEKTLNDRMAWQRSKLGLYSVRTGSLGGFIIWAALRGSAPAAPPVVPPAAAGGTAARPRKPAFPKPKKKAKPATTLRRLNRGYGKRIKAAAKTKKKGGR